MKKTRHQHNKKRNTAILYEFLVRELTKSIIKKDTATKKNILTMLKKSFRKGTALYEELKLYKSLSETKDVVKEIAEKIIHESKNQYKEKIDQQKVFTEQSTLINKINKALGKSAFLNFIPNYKNLATISQIFNTNVSPRRKVLLEQALIEHMAKKEEERKLVSYDNLIFKTFIKKFNESYDNELAMEQKELLSRYILSFSDDNLALKMFLNEEIPRLEREIKKSFDMEEVSSDKDMVEKTKKVLKLFENFKTQEISADIVNQIFKIQKLAEEIKNNDN